MDMYRDLSSIPVLAKAGGIVPFTKEISASSAVSNPSSLWIRVFAGANGSFVLYEDDNETCGYKEDICVKTLMTYTEGEMDVFVIHPAKGEVSLIPEKRTYQVELTGFSQEAAGQVEVKLDGQLKTEDQVAVAYKKETQAVEVTVKDVDITGCLEISVNSKSRTRDKWEPDRR